MGQKDSWVKAIGTVFWRVPHFLDIFYWNSEELWYQYPAFSSHFCYKTNININNVHRIQIYTVFNSKNSSIYNYESAFLDGHAFQILPSKNENDLAWTKVKESTNPRRCQIPMPLRDVRELPRPVGRCWFQKNDQDLETLRLCCLIL